MVRIFVGLAAAIGVAVFGASHAYTVESPRFKAVAFDYFVIFDPNSIVPTVDTVFPGKGLALPGHGARNCSSTASYARSLTGTRISST